MEGHMNTKTRRRWVIGAGGTATLLLILIGLWPNPVPVSVETVSRSTLQVRFQEEGDTHVRDRVLITAASSGRLETIRLEAGDAIASGQAVASIRSLRGQILDERQAEVARARLDGAEVALKRALELESLATEELEYAEREWERVSTLQESGIGSPHDADLARLALKKAQTSLQSASFGVQIARYDRLAAEASLRETGTGSEQRIDMVSPVDGIVLKIPDRRGRTVAVGEPILEIGDPRSLEIRCDVLSSDAVRLREGMRAFISRWGGEEILEAVVRTVEPSGFTKISALGVEEQRVYILLDLVSPPSLWESLGDGYRVLVEFELWRGEDVLQVPTSALFRSEEGWAVFRVEGRRAIRQRVEIGRQSGLRTQIVSGLSEGEIVVTNPDERLQDDSRIELVRRP